MTTPVTNLKNDNLRFYLDCVLDGVGAPHGPTKGFGVHVSKDDPTMNDGILEQIQKAAGRVSSGEDKAIRHTMKTLAEKNIPFSEDKMEAFNSYMSKERRTRGVVTALGVAASAVTIGAFAAIAAGFPPAAALATSIGASIAGTAALRYGEKSEPFTIPDVEPPTPPPSPK